MMQRLVLMTTAPAPRVQEYALLLAGSLCGSPAYFPWEDHSTVQHIVQLAQGRLDATVPEFHASVRQDMRITLFNLFDSLIGPALKDTEMMQLMAPCMRVIHSLLRVPEFALNIARMRPLPLAFMDLVATLGPVSAVLALNTFALFAVRVDNLTNHDFLSGNWSV